MNQLQSFLPLVLMVGAFWFLIIRPNRRRQAALAATISSLAPGARVTTSSGLRGTVISLGDGEIVLEVAPGVHTTWIKAAVTKVDQSGPVAQ